MKHIIRERFFIPSDSIFLESSRRDSTMRDSEPALAGEESLRFSSTRIFKEQRFSKRERN
ncbi:hypothetical protein [Helicobacter sp. MIT 14-3879]|uniref:hypothetical protein n=1 Tax=Helicobacter sp. MIT 14-3879 TaxID=2040649 RepID=UPI000E1F1782|nr:hypothetical protein [Helicobacter sp. MIT 14-3879]RDU60887.1 hypothetical protein CQA44_10045 [Helicobacter sp. MIT 14-3879]